MVIRLEPRELTDGELRLRPWRREDVPAMAEACRDPEIVRWTRVPENYTEDDAREFIAASDERWRRGEAAGFAVTDAASGEVLGSIGVRFVDPGYGRIGLIGYWTSPEARGRGVATRALRLLSRWALEELELPRVELLTEPENRPSQLVAENAGFKREGLLRNYLELKGHRSDGVLYSLVASDLEG